MRYLKIIEKSGYQALPWVRYITQNGGRLRVHSYLCRVPICADLRQQLGNAVQCGGNQPWTDAVLWKGDTVQNMRQCGNVLRNVRKWTFFLSSFPDLDAEITNVAHVGLFTNVATNCQTSSSHFLCVPFILGGKHQLPPLDFSPILPILLSIWLSLVHFLLRLPAPDPVGSASAGSRQVEIRGGGVEPLMRYQWQVSVMRPEDCLFFFFV